MSRRKKNGIKPMSIDNQDLPEEQPDTPEEAVNERGQTAAIEIYDEFGYKPETPASQEIKLGTVVQNTSAPLGKAATVEETKKILSQPSKAVAPTLDPFEQKVQKFLTQGDAVQQSLVGVLNRYNEEMSPNKQVDVATARTQQRALWNIIVKVMDTDQNFTDNWRMVIAFFRRYRESTFGDKYVNRFMDLLNNFNIEERQAFMNILALLSLSAGLNNPKMVHKYYVLDRGLTRPIKPDSRQRVINFYS